jgi:hypothetical protein
MLHEAMLHEAMLHEAIQGREWSSDSLLAKALVMLVLMALVMLVLMALVMRLVVLLLLYAPQPPAARAPAYLLSPSAASRQT